MTSSPEPAAPAPSPRDTAVSLLILLREVGVVLHWIVRAMLRGRGPLAGSLLALAAVALIGRRHARTVGRADVPEPRAGASR